MRAEKGPVWLGHGRRGARQDWSGGRGKGAEGRSGSIFQTMFKTVNFIKS